MTMSRIFPYLVIAVAAADDPPLSTLLQSPGLSFLFSTLDSQYVSFSFVSAFHTDISSGRIHSTSF